MDLSKYTLILYLPCFLSLLCVCTEARSIDVYPDHTSINCDPSSKISHAHLTHRTHNNQSLTQALREVTTDDKGDWTITLKGSGCYWLSEFHLISNTSKISIVGIGDNASDFSIHCSSNIGLAFTQVHNIHIENVTIDGCGISFGNADIVKKEIDRTLDIFYHIPREVGYAVIIAASDDLVMENVVISHTAGIGLLMISVGGNSAIDGLQLLHNHAPLCQFSEIRDIGSEKTIGGGMYVLYQDYRDNSSVSGIVTFTISNVFTHNNSYCQTLEAMTLLKEVDPRKLRVLVGSAGSIGVTLAQLDYGVNFTVLDSEFRNNTGWVASGVTVIMYVGVKLSTVMFDNCRFIRNGFKHYWHLPFGVKTSHSGILVVKNAHFPITKAYIPLDASVKSLILFSNSLFDGNSAEICGNIDLILFRPIYANDSCQITFRNATMIRNRGSIGPVLCAKNKDGVADFSDFLIDLEDLTVENNVVFSPTIQNNLIDHSSQLLFLSMNVIFRGNTLIKNNSGVGIIAVSSNLNFGGSVTIHKNSANFGGGVQLLDQSHIVIYNNTRVEFSENCALFEGGAIFVANSHLYATLSKTNCFLYFNTIDVLCNYSASCANVSNMNISMVFRDNTAPYGGTIFGSTLNDCPWFYDYISTAPDVDILTVNTTALQLLEEYFPNHFSFSPPLNSSKVVSTEATNLIAKPRDDYTINESSTLYDVIYPGQQKYYNISAYDAFGYRANALLLSTSNNTMHVNSTLSDTVYWFVHSSDPHGTKSPLLLIGSENVISEIYVFSSTSNAVTSINVKLIECGFGFEYNDSTQKCLCSKRTPDHVRCNVLNQSLTVPADFWYGPVKQLENLPIYQQCIYDYCSSGESVLRPYQISTFQCKTGYNRTGLLCTECMNGTGTVFGSSRCLKCNDQTLYWIPIFAVAGIFIVFVIAFLDVSCAEGYICGFIFYCNCLNYFTPYLESTTPIDYIFLLISWVNLNIGIESCFYSEMPELSRIGLRLVFPGYLYLLMFLIIVVFKYSKTLSNKVQFSAGRTFATLFILTYFSIFGTCIQLLGFYKFSTTNENGKTLTYYGWAGAVSYQYGQGLHAVLIALAAILMVTYIIPIPLLLMFPSLLYRFRYTYRFKPILDAWWNPYKPAWRRWLGLRSMFRFIPFFLALYVVYPNNIYYFFIILALGWYMQERIAPYQGVSVNWFDSFFILNMVLIMFTNMFKLQSRHGANKYRIALYTIVLSAYVAFGLIIVIHIFKRFPYLKKWLPRKTVRTMRQYMQGEKTISIVALSHARGPHADSDDSSSDDNGITHGELKIPSSDPVNFVDFREPLLAGSINDSNYDSTAVKK